MIRKTKKYICEVCGEEVLKRVLLDSGEWVCEMCYNKLQIKQTINLEVPDAIKWIGKCAKQGDNLLFIIPQGQKPFFKHKNKYVIVVRKLK